MNVNLTEAAWRLEPSLNSTSPNFLYDGDGYEILRNVLVDFNSKRFPNSESSCTTQNKKHPLPLFAPRCQARHYFGRKAGCILLLLFYDGHVDKFVVPLRRWICSPCWLTNEATTIFTT